MYMESLQPCGSAWSLGGLESERLQVARFRRLVDGNTLPLATLCELGQRQLQADPKIQQRYTQAAGMTSFFMHANQGEYRRAFLNYLTAIYDRSDDQMSLSQLSHMPFADLDSKYEAFCRLDDSDLISLDDRIAPKQLLLRGTGVTDKGLDSICRWDQLIWLDVTDNRVTDQGLANLSAAVQLRRLSLERTEITDLTVQRRVDSPNLQELDLSATRITDSAATNLGQLAELRSLWLTGTNITDRSIESLSRLKNLTLLDVSGTKISPEGWRRLRASLPNLQNE